MFSFQVGKVKFTYMAGTYFEWHCAVQRFEDAAFAAARFPDKVYKITFAQLNIDIGQNEVIALKNGGILKFDDGIKSHF